MRAKKLCCLVLALGLILPMLPAALAAETTAETADTTAATTEAVTQATTLPAPAAAFPEVTQATAAAATEATTEATAEATTEPTVAETEPEETEPQAVPVVFQCEPEEATVSVYYALEDAESRIEPLDDPTTYLLAPGEYYYYADCDGYQAASVVPFTVEAGAAVQVIRITLTPLSQSVTLRYDAQGGECAVTEETVAIGGTASGLPVAYREGWRFVGWFTAEGFSERFDLATPLTQDTTLYAHWSLRYNEGTLLSFDTAGGELSGPLFTVTAEEADGDGSTEGITVFTHAGDVIDLSDTVQVAVNSAGRVTKTGSGLTVPEGGFVLSAPLSDEPTEAGAALQSIGLGHYVGIHWNSMTVSVYGGRDALLYSAKYATGDSYGALPTPMQEGKRFLGWFTDPQGGEQVTASTAFSSDSPTILYAHWGDECEHSYTADYHRSTADGPGYTLYTCDKCGATEKVYFGNEWSDWTAERPYSANADLIDSRTEYRTRVKEFTTNLQASLTGWTRYGNVSVWGDWGAWGDWSLTPAEQTCYVQVETAPLYRYYCYYCTRCGARSATPGGCGCDANGAIWQEIWSPIPYSESKAQEHSAARMSTTSLGDGKEWYFASGNLNDTVLSTAEAGGSGSVIRLGYRTRSRVKTTAYLYYRWSDWSDWSGTEATATAYTDVQTRTAYRSYTAALPTTQEEDCATCPDDEE